MKIESLNPKYLLTQKAAKTDKRKNASSTQEFDRDTIQISVEAQKLNETKVQGKDLDLIKSRIEEKFYNSEEIINSVAEAIIKEIKSS